VIMKNNCLTLLGGRLTWFTSNKEAITCLLVYFIIKRGGRYFRTRFRKVHFLFVQLN